MMWGMFGAWGKDEQVKLKKQQQLNNLATQKDVVALSRELLAMHGSGGKASKKRRFAQQLAKMNEKSERVASYGLREAAKCDNRSGEEEDTNSQKMKHGLTHLTLKRDCE